MNENRRDFVKKSGLLLLSGTLPFAGLGFPFQRKSLGVALVGLGYYSTDLLAPALQLTKNCHLAGIVTGSPEKIPRWQSRYGIKDNNVYDYRNMHQIANNDDIDVIYIVLPTGLHAKYSILAANTGKHVWCEKPMARTEAECLAIIDACKKNRVKLSIGYRMQHEPNTRTIMQWAKSKPYGAMNSVIAEAGYYDGRKDHWKLKKAMGGGAMYDMGVYPLNAARYTVGKEPISVSATHLNNRKKLFNEVDETTMFTLSFPDGTIADCRTSLGESMNLLDVQCKNGWYRLEPFQSYTGVGGTTSDHKKLIPFKGNQQARQMDDDALAIMEDKPVLVPGEEGARDIRIVEAIYRSAAQGGRKIQL